MRFSFTPEQLELRAGAAALMSALCTPADLRAILEDASPSVGRSDERWSALAELGATGILAPEEAGGLGLSEVELIGVLEEAGKVALPEPLGVHAFVAVPLLAAIGAGSLLADAAAGTVIVSVGGVDADAEGPVVVQSDGELSTGRVEAASRAASFLLAVARDGGVELHLLDRSDVAIRLTPTLDPSRDLGEITWSPSAATKVAQGPEAVLLVDMLCSRLAVQAAAQLCGLAETMLSITAAYALDRVQFGKPIGSFQSVKHLLADVRISLEFARPAVYRAAWSLATDDDELHHDAALAKALSSALAEQAAASCLQVHGAIGYTFENDLQLFLRRSWGLAAAYGDAATQRARAMGLGLGI